MKLVTCVIYYDESPRWLSSGMASLASVTDAFVYLDGAYFLYPGGIERPASDVECALALHDTAAGLNKPLLHYRPAEPFYANEVEKRQMYIDLAQSLPGVNGDTWFLVVDADQVVSKCDPLGLRTALEQTSALVAEYAVSSYDSRQDAVDEGAPDYTHAHDAASITNVRGLYRNIPELHYGPAHYVLSGLDPDDRSFGYLWGQPKLHQPYAEAEDCTSSLVVAHRRTQRVAARNLAAREYYDLRDATGIESMTATYVEGLDGRPTLVR